MQRRGTSRRGRRTARRTGHPSPKRCGSEPPASGFASRGGRTKTVRQAGEAEDRRTTGSFAGIAGRAALWPPLAAAALYLVVLAVFLPRMVAAVFWNSDIASIPLLAG